MLRVSCFIIIILSCHWLNGLFLSYATPYNISPKNSVHLFGNRGLKWDSWVQHLKNMDFLVSSVIFHEFCNWLSVSFIMSKLVLQPKQYTAFCSPHECHYLFYSLHILIKWVFKWSCTKMNPNCILYGACFSNSNIHYFNWIWYTKQNYV